MPKGILEFQLPEEMSEYVEAIKAGQYKSILDELDNYLRGKVKYGEKNQEVYQEIRDWLREEIQSYGD